MNDPKTRVVTSLTLFSAIGVSLFIITELVLVAAAAVWAVSGMFQVPVFITAIMAMIVGIPTVWAATATAILVFNAETDPQNNRDLLLSKKSAPELPTGGQQLTALNQVSV